MNGIQRTGRLIGAFFTGIVCLVLIAVGILTYRDARALDDHGVTIEVPIQDHLLTKGAKGGATYEIIYTFNAPAQPQPIYVFHRETVTQEAYNRLQIGQTIRVQYLPENPYTTRMLEPGSADSALGLGAIALFMGVMTALLIYAAFTGKGLLA